MKLCTAVQEGCGYKDTLRAHRYFAPLAKYFTVCIIYQPAYVLSTLKRENESSILSAECASICGVCFGLTGTANAWGNKATLIYRFS
jgi:hypothetical protein